MPPEGDSAYPPGLSPATGSSLTSSSSGSPSSAAPESYHAPAAPPPASAPGPIRKRALIACNRCHSRKIKCNAALPSCSMCAAASATCSYERPIRKRGKPARPPPPTVPTQRVYPVLDELTDLPFSKAVASEILEGLYTTGSHDPLWIVRRRNLLSIESPRKTSKGLLYAILCYSSHKRTESQSERGTALSQVLIRLALQYMPDTLRGKAPTLDDCLYFHFLTFIAGCTRNLHHLMIRWMANALCMARELRLFAEAEDLSVQEEEREERRRLWWALMFVDRHSAVSFNRLPYLQEEEALELYLPCSSDLWHSDRPLPPSQLQMPPRSRGLQPVVSGCGVFDILIPCTSCFEAVLDFHHHRSKPAPSIGPLRDVHATLLDALGAQAKALLTQFESSLGTVEKRDADKFTILMLYARHIIHTLYILVYGKWDVWTMMQDAEWVASQDFLVAIDHTVRAAQATSEILQVDPHLAFFPAIYGTYLLQASFISLIIVHQLGASTDERIIWCSETFLAALEVYERTVNQEYHSAFAAFFRRALERAKALRSVGQVVGLDALAKFAVEDSPDDDGGLPPILYRFRWTPGWHGLDFRV